MRRNGNVDKQRGTTSVILLHICQAARQSRCAGRLRNSARNAAFRPFGSAGTFIALMERYVLPSSRCPSTDTGRSIGSISLVSVRPGSTGHNSIRPARKRASFYAPRSRFQGGARAAIFSDGDRKLCSLDCPPDCAQIGAARLSDDSITDRASIKLRRATNRDFICVRDHDENHSGHCGRSISPRRGARRREECQRTSRAGDRGIALALGGAPHLSGRASGLSGKRVEPDA